MLCTLSLSLSNNNIKNNKHHSIFHFLCCFFDGFESATAVEFAAAGHRFILIPFPPSFKEIKMVLGLSLAGLTIF